MRKMRNNAEIIELIKQICNEKGISLSELARKTGMAKSNPFVARRD